MEKVIYVPVCIDRKWGISKNGKIPWNHKEDMKWLLKLTKDKRCVCAKKTFDSIPSKGDLYDRIQTVITLSELKDKDKTTSCYMNIIWEHDIILGGTSIYQYIARFIPPKDICVKFLFHQLDEDYECDNFFPFDEFSPKEWIISYNDPLNQIESDDIKCFEMISFDRLFKPTEGEFNYQNILNKILSEGIQVQSRNSMVRKIFGEQIRFDLSKGFPLLTTKKVFFRGIVEELLWFLRGDTNSKILEAKKVNIWKGNSTREFLDSRGLHHYEEGDCGPIYGYQWRFWGKSYDSPDGGIDQIKDVIHQLKTNPMSRRIIISGWNVADLSKMALPPCHVMYQFFVSENKLSCCMTQRSGDVFLGVPFNIASTALLTHFIAALTGFNVGEILINITDAHIYENHTEACLTQLTRSPRVLPFLKIPVEQMNSLGHPICWSKLSANDIQLIGYHPSPPIKADMIA